MASETPDPVAAGLGARIAEVSEDVTLAAAAVANERLAPSARREAARELAHWAPRLLGAVEAVLKLIADWEVHAQEIDDGTGMTLTSVRAMKLRGCADQLREVITRELLAKEGSDG
jgi:hypothetical protein